MNSLCKAAIYRFVLFVSSAQLFISCGGIPFGNKTSDLTAEDHVSNAKWLRFSEYVGLPTTPLSPNSHDPHFYESSYATPPTSTKRDAYFLDPNNEPLDAKQNQWYKNLKTGEFSQDPKLADAPQSDFVLWTRNAEILENVKKINSAQKWRTQCGGIAGIGPYRSDAHGLLSTEGKTLWSLGKKGEKNSQSVYLLKYFVKDSADAVDPTEHLALLTVPNNPSRLNRNLGLGDEFPLLLYAHAGDSGLSYDEIAKILSVHANQYVIAAPTYPGEPLCSFQSIHGKRICRDDAKNVIDPVLPVRGKRAALEDEAFNLLALQNCISHFLASEGAVVPELDANYDATGKQIASPIAGKMLYNYSKNRDLEESLATVLPDKTKEQISAALKERVGVSTIAVGASRGGGVALISLARAGLLLQDWSETATVDDLISGEYFPNFINSIALFFPPSAMLMGPFRFLAQVLMRGAHSEKFEPLPMYPELRELFDEYQRAPAGTVEERRILENVAAQLAVRDMAYVGPYAAVTLQNWRSFWNSATPNVKNFSLTGGLTAQSQKGALSIYHGTEDRVVPFNQSIIAGHVLSMVSSFAKNPRELFFKNNIPGFSHAVFAFQPMDDFYTDSYSFQSKTCGPKQHVKKRINKHRDACFSRDEELLCHGDISFATAGLVNIISPSVTQQGSTPIMGPDLDVESKMPGKLFFDEKDVEKGSPRLTYQDVIDEVYAQFQNFSYKEFYEAGNVPVPKRPEPVDLRTGLAYILGNSESSPYQPYDFDDVAEGTIGRDTSSPDYVKRSKRYNFTTVVDVINQPYNGDWAATVEKELTPAVMFDLWMNTAAVSTLLDQNYNACFGQDKCKKE